jgi:hypothetical protein
MLDEHVEFLETAFVQQHRKPFPCGLLAFLVLRVNPLLSSAKPGCSPAFYQFGDMFFIKRIPTEKWVPFIVSRFADSGKAISPELAQKICDAVDNYSSYVQQLAWNVFAVSGPVVTEQDVQDGFEATMAQSVSLFVEQTANLTSYQLNLIRAISQGFHQDFGSKEVANRFALGTKSNLAKLKKALVEREIIEITESGCYIADPMFERWFTTEMK